MQGALWSALEVKYSGCFESGPCLNADVWSHFEDDHLADHYSVLLMESITTSLYPLRSIDG